MEAALRQRAEAEGFGEESIGKGNPTELEQREGHHMEVEGQPIRKIVWS